MIPKESIKELIVLLKESEFNPNNYKNLEQDRALRDRDIDYSSKNETGLEFLEEEKTGNYSGK